MTRLAMLAVSVASVCGVAEGQRERATFQPVAGETLDAPGFVVDSVHFGALDTRALEGEDVTRALDGEMPRFAVASEVDYAPEAFGSIQLLGGGRIAWRLDIYADGARSINIGALFDVPESMSMYLLDARGQTLWGAFTRADRFRGEMWSPVVPGEVMRIYAEMDEDDWDRFSRGFRITRVNIGYRGVGAALPRGVDRSDACQTDVACPEADAWCEQVKGVVCYTIDGTGVCSGSILNNTASDGRPLLYTAFHCRSQDSPASLRVYFNFQNASCRTPGSPASAGEGTCGDINLGGMPCDTQTIAGASVVATQQDADAVLLELASVPPESFGVVYLGWSAAETVAAAPPGGAGAAGIHHPGVEEKRIAFEQDPYIGREQISIGFTVNTWAIDFDNGGLEPGSSGSPLFDGSGRVIGAVSGADQVSHVCSQNQRYGRLEHAWDTNPAFRSALDPVGGGTIEVVDLMRGFTPTAPEAFGFGAISPGEGSTTRDTGPNLVWNGACYADTYRVRVSASVDLSNPIVDQIVAAPTRSLDLAGGTLAYDAPYFWRVDAMNTTGTTSGSTVSFRTPLAPAPGVPGAFSLLSLPDGATGVDRGPLLDWEDSTGALEYLVEIDDDVAFATPAISVVISATLSPSELDLPAGTLEFNTWYAWRVTAMNDSGSTASEPSVFTFLTAMGPACPCTSDLDGDCDSDVFDFGVFLLNFGASVPPGTSGDMDGNGTVDVFDFGLFAPDFGCAI